MRRGEPVELRSFTRVAVGDRKVGAACAVDPGQRMRGVTPSSHAQSDGKINKRDF